MTKMTDRVVIMMLVLMVGLHPWFYIKGFGPVLRALKKMNLRGHFQAKTHKTLSVQDQHSELDGMTKEIQTKDVKASKIFVWALVVNSLGTFCIKWHITPVHGCSDNSVFR